MLQLLAPPLQQRTVLGHVHDRPRQKQGSPLGRLRTSAWFSSEKVVPPGFSAVMALKMTMPATTACIINDTDIA